MILLAPLLLSSAFVGLQPVPAQPEADPESQRVIVTGERPERDPRGGVEAPYPEVERVPLGSRIARRVAQRPFRSVASDSGVGGVSLTEDGGFDGTGGSSHGFRMRRVTECVPEHDQVSEEVACILFRVKRNTELGDYDAAAGALAPLLARRHLTAWERYYIGYFAYRLGDAVPENARRERGLDLMLASGRMEDADRRQALRALAGMALQNGDDATAISRFERLVQADADARSLANLAALYARNGRTDQARTRMAQAVALARQTGETPPQEWTAFLAQPQF